MLRATQLFSWTLRSHVIGRSGPMAPLDAAQVVVQNIQVSLFVNLEDLPAQSSKILIGVGFVYVCS